MSCALAAGLVLAGASAAAQEHKHHEAGPAVAPSYSPQSAPQARTLYDLGLTVTRSDGKAIDLASLKGRPTIITMFFASCPDVCPLMTEHLLQAEKRIPPAERQRLQVVLVSFDDRDRPEILEAYRKAHGIDSDRWTVAVASPETSDVLAKHLGVRFQRLPNGAFSHSAMVDVVAPDGTLMAQVPATSLDDPRFIAAARATIEMTDAPKP